MNRDDVIAMLTATGLFALLAGATAVGRKLLEQVKAAPPGTLDDALEQKVGEFRAKVSYGVEQVYRWYRKADLSAPDPRSVWSQVATAFWHGEQTWDPEGGTKLYNWQLLVLRREVYDTMRREGRWIRDTDLARREHQDPTPYDPGKSPFVPTERLLNARKALELLEKIAGDDLALLVREMPVKQYAEDQGVSLRTAYNRRQQLEAVAEATLKREFGTVPTRGVLPVVSAPFVEGDDLDLMVRLVIIGALELPRLLAGDREYLEILLLELDAAEESAIVLLEQTWPQLQDPATKGGVSQLAGFASVIVSSRPGGDLPLLTDE